MNTRRTNLRCRWGTIAVWSACAVLGGNTVLAEPQLASNSPGVWAKSLSLIEDGQFDDAAAAIADLDRLGGEGVRLADWLRQRQDMQRSRDEMTRTDLEKYVAWAQEQHAKKKIQHALGYAAMAYDNTALIDHDSFRAQQWLTDLRADALVEAVEQREKSEWLDAHAIYYQLARIYERDDRLRKAKRECLTHARLEVTYKSDGKWSDGLQGIEWRMGTRALDRINRYYVHEVDFRKLTIAALEQLVLLGNSPALREVFPSLADDLDRSDFVTRLQAKIDQAREVKRFTAGKAAEFFRRAGDINHQTVQLPEAVIISEFMNGGMETLDDFSTIIWPVEFREFDKHTRGDFIGVGISIAKINGEITVVTPLEDSSAYYAGILADDVIIEVDGQSTGEWSLTKAVEFITGPINTHVNLTIRRKVDGLDQELEYKLKRRLVVLQSVKGLRRSPDDPQVWEHMVDRELGIGYIRVGSFQGNTVEHLRDTIRRLRDDEGLEELILDLRFNPGGLLRSAVEMTELFVHKGDKIVSTNGERTHEWPVFADRTGPFVDLPLIVLINAGSASASEIVAGALKDHHRATLIGERTFGKFSVQNLMQLDGTEGHLKLTTAAYYLPSGKSLHRTDDATEWGVDPDIEVALVPKEIIKVRMMQRESDVLGPAQAASGDAATPEEAATAPQKGAGPKTATPEDGSEKADQPEAPEAAADEQADPDAPVKAKGDAETDAKTGDKGDDDNEEEEEEEPLPPDPNERPEIDPQLEAAVLVARANRLARRMPRFALQQGAQPAKVGVEE
ncbi:MAG: S41 family peptidase [Planctomycetes bacterium]|nr:S41 family peptidase [Planctomycetota bacterium]